MRLILPLFVLATSLCLAATCASAEPRLRGPLLLQSLDPSMNAAINGAALTGHMAVTPVAHPAHGFAWEAAELPGLLDHPLLARIELPAPGHAGTVTNDLGMCLTQLSPLWGPYWFDCEGRDGQRWSHRDGALWTSVDGVTGFLSFVPNHADDGRWIFLRPDDAEPTQANVRILSEFLHPVAGLSSTR